MIEIFNFVEMIFAQVESFEVDERLESFRRREFVAAKLQSVKSTQFRSVQIRHATDSVV